MATKDLKKAFFEHFRERLEILEKGPEQERSRVFVNVEPSERLWNFLEQVGGFLFQQGVITEKDYNHAGSMVQDYDKLLEETYGR